MFDIIWYTVHSLCRFVQLHNVDMTYYFYVSTQYIHSSTFQKGANETLRDVEFDTL